MDIGGVIELANLTLESISYAQTIGQATKKKEELSAEIETNLKPTLESLDKVRSELDAASAAAFEKQLNSLKQCINECNKKLLSSDDFWKRWAKRLYWPISLKELEAALQKIRQNIKDLRELLKLNLQFQDGKRKSAQELGKRIETLINRLMPDPKLVDRLKKASTRITETTNGTGEWFFKEKKYRDLMASKSQLLAIQGMQGTGKTGLAMNIGDKISRQDPSFRIARVYCDHQASNLITDYMDIVMCLCSQLTHPTSNLHFEPELVKQWEDKLGSGGSEAELKMAFFRHVMAQVGKTMLIIDGLDEVAQAYARHIVRRLGELQEANQQCKAIVTFRPYFYIVNLFQTVPNFVLKANKLDIKLYIEDRLSREGGHLDTFKGFITRELIDKCQDTFLMAQIHMDEVIRAQDQRDVKDIIANLPSDAETAYDRGLERLSKMCRVSGHNPDLPCQPIQALFWVAYATAPMTKQELKQALAVDAKDQDYQSDRESLCELDILCGRLLTIDYASQEVRVAHRTVTEYLRLEKWRQKWFPSIREHIHTALLTYLRFPCMRTPLESDSSRDDFVSRHSLVPYALRYWGHNLQKILEVHGESLSEISKAFLTTPFHDWNEYLQEKIVKTLASKLQCEKEPLNTLSPGYISGLHWVAYFGLDSLMSFIHDYEIHHPVVHPVPMTPLGFAIAIKENKMAQEMMNKGTPLNMVQSHNRALRLPLCDALCYTNNEMASLLLRSEADLTLRHPSNDESPLDYAYTLGIRSLPTLIADFICRKKAINAQELQFLVRGAFPQQLSRAIENGIDINQPCENGKQALDYANELGNTEVISILADNHATKKLVWPPSLGSFKYPLNFEESSGAGPAITAHQYWGEGESCVEVISNGQDTAVHYNATVGDGNASNNALSGNGRPIDLLMQRERNATSRLLVELTVDARVKMPVQTIVFETVSRDQGWSSHENKGTYIGSERSWLDFRVCYQEEESKPYRVQHNVQASKQFRVHTNVWNLAEMETYSPLRAQLMRDIRHGSKLQVFAHAAGGSGWTNEVSFVQIRVYGTQVATEK